jgi:hypothetical protein
LLPNILPTLLLFAEIPPNIGFDSPSLFLLNNPLNILLPPLTTLLLAVPNIGVLVSECGLKINGRFAFVLLLFCYAVVSLFKVPNNVPEVPPNIFLVGFDVFCC